MSDNLMPGSGWLLGQMERAADAYDVALNRAWGYLADLAPDGVGWELHEDWQDERARFVFEFRDAGGLEFTTTVDPWYEPDEPDW